MPETAVWPQHSRWQLPSPHSLQQFLWIYIATLQVFLGLDWNIMGLSGLQLRTVKVYGMVKYGLPFLPYEWPDICIHMRAAKSAIASMVDWQLLCCTVAVTPCVTSHQPPAATSHLGLIRCASVLLCRPLNNGFTCRGVHGCSLPPSDGAFPCASLGIRVREAIKWLWVASRSNGKLHNWQVTTQHSHSPCGKYCTI